MDTISSSFRRRGERVILLAVMVLLSALLSWSILVAAKEQVTEDAETWPAVAASQSTYTVCLPVVMKNYPPPPPTFGMWMGVGSSRNLTLAADAGAYWINTTAFNWVQIEPIRTEPAPTYLWGTVDEQGLSNATQAGLVPVARVHLTPPWARELPDHNCSRIKRESLGEFAQFLTALVNRYKAPPYNIKYWELDSEVDVDPSLVDPANPGGQWCWGDQSDDYYGGGYFAEMLKYAYPAIKAADPGAQVVIGGLLLDCDPTHPPQGKDCKPSKFLEGILRNGGGNYFDTLSFHGHAPYYGSLQQDEHYPSWEYRGGVVLGKVNFLREVMTNYGVSKPLMHTEGSLLCRSASWCNPPNTTFFEKQAEYVVWLFVRNWAEGVLGTTWFRFDGPGEYYSGMLDANQDPKPVYWAFRFLTTELGDASYSGRVTLYPELRGYAFTASGKRIWVLWAPDEQLHTITLPGGVTSVYDKYGSNITPPGLSIAVSSPIYVELGP